MFFFNLIVFILRILDYPGVPNSSQQQFGGFSNYPVGSHGSSIENQIKPPIDNRG